MPDSPRQDTSRIVAECTGCGGFCGAEELYLADMKVSRAGGAAIVMFRSWRCLIRHGIKQHELSKESRPAVRCSDCARTVAEERLYCSARMEESDCAGILRFGWEDVT